MNDVLKYKIMQRRIAYIKAVHEEIIRGKVYGVSTDRVAVAAGVFLKHNLIIPVAIEFAKRPDYAKLKVM